MEALKQRIDEEVLTRQRKIEIGLLKRREKTLDREHSPMKMKLAGVKV